MLMTATYAVTFEFETKPPLTLHGEVSASGMPTLVARAARTAMQEAGRQTWSSVVVVIERVKSSAEVDDDARRTSTEPDRARLIELRSKRRRSSELYEPETVERFTPERGAERTSRQQPPREIR